MPKNDNNSEKERRQYERVKKSFILSYFDPSTPNKKFEITQLKNISLGGMCFVTTQPFKTSTKLHIELKTPYIAGTTALEGVVLASHEKMKNCIYETRLKFETLDTESKLLLGKLSEYFVEAKDQTHE